MGLVHSECAEGARLCGACKEDTLFLALFYSEVFQGGSTQMPGGPRHTRPLKTQTLPDPCERLGEVFPSLRPQFSWTCLSMGEGAFPECW